MDVLTPVCPRAPTVSLMEEINTPCEKQENTSDVATESGKERRFI